jgi:hypothetical protein
MKPMTTISGSKQGSQSYAEPTILYALERLVDRAKPNFLEDLVLRKAKIRRRVAWTRLGNGNSAAANEKFDDARCLLCDYLAQLPANATQYVAHPFERENLETIRFMIESHAQVDELPEATRMAHLYLDAVMANGAGIDCISRPCHTLSQLYRRQKLVTEASFLAALPKRIAVLNALNERRSGSNSLLPTDWPTGDDLPSRIRYSHLEVLALHFEKVSGWRLWQAFDNLHRLYNRLEPLEHARIYEQLAWNVICKGERHPSEINAER